MNSTLANLKNRSGAIRSLLDDTLLHSQNAATLRAAHTLLRSLSFNKQFPRAPSTTPALSEVLASLGFGGLWRSCSFGSMEEVNRDYLDLTERLIEVCKTIKKLKYIY